jgi:hypothetical protein
MCLLRKYCWPGIAGTRLRGVGRANRRASRDKSGESIMDDFLVEERDTFYYMYILVGRRVQSEGSS